MCVGNFNVRLDCLWPDRNGAARILAVGDTIRANAIEAIKSLHAAGVEKIIMLSGDNQRTVDAISKQVGIDEAKGDLLLDQKIERVRELLAQHKHVGMIGDGVNDAPAMAAASIGIAMGGAGTGTAIETADIALMQDDLSKVAEVIQLGRRTVRIIQTNIAFALIVKAGDSGRHGRYVGRHSQCAAVAQSKTVKGNLNPTNTKPTEKVILT